MVCSTLVMSKKSEWDSVMQIGLVMLMIVKSTSGNTFQMNGASVS